MAALAVLAQELLTVNGVAFSITKLRIASTSDTVTVPAGVLSASALGATAARTASASAVSTGDTITITSGTSGEIVWLVCRHSSGQGGMGAV
jgi:hydroxyethylthiazole kinase-like sugar kinase family protein